MRVLRALGEFGRAGANAKLVAKKAGLPKRTVDRHLRDLVQDEVIFQPFRGVYVAQPGAPDLTADPWSEEGIHGLALVARWRNGILRARERGEASAPDLSGPKIAGEMEYRQGTRWGVVKKLWRHWWVEVRYYPSTGRLVVYVPSTKRPIPFDQFGHLQAWLEGALGIEDAGDLFFVTEIGIHSDTEGWRLKGIKAIELRRFSNALEQFYQKGSKVRREVHIHPKELSLAQAMAIIKEGSPTVRLERMLKEELKIEEARPRSKQEEKGIPGPALGQDGMQTGYG